MSSTLSVSIIITTYNWPEALRLTIKSVLNQSILPDEIIIADDGSGPETETVIKDTLTGYPGKWCHVWHEDKGVRQSRIKNLAVKYSNGNYLIFIDQDVLLHPCFVEDHIKMARKGVFLQGKRLFLSKELTQRVLLNGDIFVPHFLIRGIKNRKNALRIPWVSKLLTRKKGFQKTLRGSNLSMFKEDFIKVDGFDEIYDGSWGREDSDLCYRLFHSGIKCINLWFCALQYHLFHESIKNNYIFVLDGYIREMLNERRKMALKGFSKLSSEGKIILCSR